MGLRDDRASCPGGGGALARVLAGLRWRAARSRVSPDWRPGRASMRGVSAVEFAILLPLLLVIFAGIVDFGLMLYNKAMITNAAREAARAGIMARVPRLDKTAIENIATDYCFTRSASGVRTQPPLTITLGIQHDCTATATVPNSITPLVSELTVTVSYTYQGPVVSLMALITGSPLALGPMSSTATMKYE